MDEYKRMARDQDSDSPDSTRRPSLLAGLAGMLRDEAIDHVVSTASGGWLGYDGDDEEDDRPQNSAPSKDSFNDRLERALAEMRAQQDAEPAQPSPVAAVPASNPPRPVPPGLTGGVRSFGRKAV